ncbi:Lysophospholipid acyltransferase 1 [Gonapodya sp. JEL0774]|nr:Lysophospholipid acyltransferase 1 [Gonapodya sp. JEL0774]
MLDTFADWIAASLGINSDGILLVLAIVAAYPVAVCSRLLPTTRWIRDMFSVATTAMVLINVWGYTEYLHVVTATFYTYFISSTFRDRKWMPVLIHCMALLHLAYLFTKLVKDPGTNAQKEVPSEWATVATFASSAFWHGFHFGYYVFFVSGVPLTIVAKSFRRAFRPLFVPPSPYAKFKPMYDVLTWAATQLIMNYLAISYILLTWDKISAVYGALHYAGHVGLLVLLVILKLGGLEGLMLEVQKSIGLGQARTITVRENGKGNEGDGTVGMKQRRARDGRDME